MTKRDISAIESAKDIKKYCGEHVKCTGCALWTDDCACILEADLAADWVLPEAKTYKQDFLEKFPGAKFGSSEICRRFIYGEDLDYCGMTCEECWNETYITDRTEERSK